MVTNIKLPFLIESSTFVNFYITLCYQRAILLTIVMHFSWSVILDLHLPTHLPWLKSKCRSSKTYFSVLQLSEINCFSYYLLSLELSRYSAPSKLSKHRINISLISSSSVVQHWIQVQPSSRSHSQQWRTSDL